MKQYKVIGTVAICPPQRTKLKRGEVKPESFFVDGQIAELLGRGMIVEFKEEVGNSIPTNGEGVDLNDATTIVDGETDLSTLNKLELQSLCNEKNIAFATTDTKAKLIELLTTPAA